ncbi:exodeoxyribonuclease VII small subunit [Cetobacterium sp. SF1]|uniref:exodeoxyribonuclease VII small subunit n=1 Tax=unclassified Cetobacterium TaxID=2630983 RepID=UPI003CF01C0F
MKKNSFEYNLQMIDEIISKLEMGTLGLNDSIKEYEKAMKLLKKSNEMLEEGEGIIKKISLGENGEILEEVVEENV